MHMFVRPPDRNVGDWSNEYFVGLKSPQQRIYPGGEQNFYICWGFARQGKKVPWSGQTARQRTSFRTTIHNTNVHTFTYQHYDIIECYNRKIERGETELWYKINPMPNGRNEDLLVMGWIINSTEWECRSNIHPKKRGFSLDSMRK